MLVLSVVALTLPSFVLAECQGRPEVQIPQGRLSGMSETTVKGRPFYAFRNIPFAKPPVGDLRFKDPEPAGKWQGTRDASSDPPRCIQQPYFLIFVNERVADGEEDCLYLNVFTPKVRASLPVMVWIYGGGFFAGEASSYPPGVILERDVVLVVVQYRLGVFGFLSTEDSVIPGNFGLKDQTLALRWVQENIGYFGGDPELVTIFGQSAGGASVHHQMLTPKAKGLFSRAIMHSGCAFNTWALDSSHTQSARRIGGSVGCSLEEGSQAFLKCMQGVPAEEVSLALSNTFEFLITPLLMVPRVDGDFLPDRPEVLMASGNYNKVPIISGVVKDEGAIAIQYIFSVPALKENLVSNFSFVPLSMALKGESPQVVENQALQALHYYVGNTNYDDQDAEVIRQLYGDFVFAVGQDVTSLLNSRYRPTYAYEFQHRGKLSFSDSINMDKIDPSLAQELRSWVSHGDDLFYLFSGGLVPPLEDTTDLALRDIIVTLWINFASTGNPTPDNSLGCWWEKVAESSFKHLVLKPQPHMQKDTRAERRRFWLDLPVFENLKKALQTNARSMGSYPRGILVYRVGGGGGGGY